MMIDKQKTDLDILEVLLTEAGMSFEVVDRCLHPECEICTAIALEAA